MSAASTQLRRPRGARFGRPLRIAIVAGAAASVLLIALSRPLLPSMGPALALALAPSRLLTAVGGQIASLLLCSLALHTLVPAASLRTAVLSRWVRDAVGALPVSVPGLSEAAGVRMLGLAGLTATDALAVTSADVLAETLAQAAYAVCASALAPLSLRLPHGAPSVPLSEIAGLACAALVVLGLVLRLAPRAWRARLSAVLSATFARLRSPGFALSLLLHCTAWACGGVQIFLLARLLHAPLGLSQALSLEGLVFAARAAAFVVPAGLGVQELALGGVGAAYGLPAQAIVTLALLLRLRDLIAYSPALAIWFAGELRRAMRPDAIAAQLRLVPAGGEP